MMTMALGAGPPNSKMGSGSAFGSTWRCGEGVSAVPLCQVSPVLGTSCSGQQLCPRLPPTWHRNQEQLVPAVCGRHKQIFTSRYFLSCFLFPLPSCFELNGRGSSSASSLARGSR